MSVRALFLDIDTQHDFMDPDGKLSVPGAAEITGNLARLTQFAVEHGIPILSSADAHQRGDPTRSSLTSRSSDLPAAPPPNSSSRSNPSTSSISG